jgi:hypothetical protein
MPFGMAGEPTTSLLLKSLLCLTNPRSGGVSRVAKGADCKSAALWLRRFESYLPHHQGQGIKLREQIQVSKSSASMPTAAA